MRWITALIVCVPTAALARPMAPGIFCARYDASPLCSGGQVSCEACHAGTPAPGAPNHNVYGLAVKDALGNRDFDMFLVEAITAVESDDSDGDTFSNADEIMWGTWPGDAGSFPLVRECPSADYDPAHVYKRLSLDVCGRAPTFDERQTFDALSTDAEKMDALHAALDSCLDSAFWMGKNGALWEMAHRKVRPIGALKAGEDQGTIPVSDYYDDYNLYVWAHTDDNDVRDVLTADYFVERTGEATYARLDDKAGQNAQPGRRAGMVTTNWYLIYFVMFTAVPRTAAAQAYRSYLNLDIAKLEGLRPVDGEPVDWDVKGVTEETCAVCHSTLDPLTYPFSRYEGFPGATYDANRMQRYLFEGPNIGNMPEGGMILGEPVADLMEWVQIAANSDEFAVAVVEDYWKLMIGHAPTVEEQAEFEVLWTGLKTTHGYSVEQMLHALIETEAYGVR